MAETNTSTSTAAASPKKGVQRAGTMDITAAEAKEYLQEAGRKDLLPAQTKGNGPETRTKHQAREVLDTILGQKRNHDQSMDENSLKAQFRMAFRVFDKDHSGDITASELADVMRSLGKRPLKKRVMAMLSHYSLTAADTRDH